MGGSLTGQLTIEGGQGDGKSLHGTQGEAVIHGEDVLGHAAKLHHDVILCRTRQQGVGITRKEARRHEAALVSLNSPDVFLPCTEKLMDVRHLTVVWVDDLEVLD